MRDSCCNTHPACRRAQKREDATAMQAEGMKMLQDGFAKKDMSKVSAANVMLSKSMKMFQRKNQRKTDTFSIGFYLLTFPLK